VAAPAQGALLWLAETDVKGRLCSGFDDSRQARPAKTSVVAGEPPSAIVMLCHNFVAFSGNLLLPPAPSLPTHYGNRNAFIKFVIQVR
jgi:hypothetical protein